MTSLELNIGVGTPREIVRVSGDGVFATVQGEGVSAGRPSIFLRTQECNLHCGQNNVGWRCDAAYTWDKSLPEYAEGLRLASVEELALEIQQSWHDAFLDEEPELQPNLVLTGGEPLLQQAKLGSMLKLLPGWHSEVETNGTVIVGNEFSDLQINCSPKLASSGNTLRARRRLSALKSVADIENHWFKFVVTGQEDVEEIKEVMEAINGGDFERVLLMGEGITVDELECATTWLHGVAASLGCQVTERNHIYWFGNKRRT